MARARPKDVCIFIPALNEARTIGQVIDGFRELGFRDILVVDGKSTDGTAEAARSHGAKVVVQHGRGKGQAIQQAFSMVDCEYLVMIDGDLTYLPSEVDRLLAPLLDGRADHVIGNRFANYQAGAFTRLNLFGNKVLNKMFGLAYGVWLHDILSGYRAFNRHTLQEMELREEGFEIESEMTIESVRRGLRVIEVPITYRTRIKGAKTKLKPMRHGWRIGSTILRLGRTYNPLLFIGLLGLFFVLAGLSMGLYVLWEWLGGTNHIPLTILTALAVISGIQMVIFGFLGEMVVQSHREMLRRMHGLEMELRRSRPPANPKRGAGGRKAR